MNTKLIKQYKYLSFLGFIGLTGLVYFISKDTKALFYLAYLSFFGFFFIYKHLQKGIDERTIENISKANRITASIALFFLFLLGAIPTLVLRPFEVECSSIFFILGSAIGTFCTIVMQIATFFYYEKNNTMAEFTSYLKEYRIKANLTQEELALKVNVRRETIIRLEAGKYNPSLKLAIDISRVLKVSIECLFIF